ncbi:hypothetical protein MA16_Dca014869 [Dendrobium catenatum]|uniref:Uncharacterized protein n=1 Tax=Dendrobium catenatum TaxID=906689 RepID=A0A2I0V6U2_9ASPA|nr:hypothetical protein MA16_Dca014869 [Dendrobium catenatum]
MALNSLVLVDSNYSGARNGEFLFSSVLASGTGIEASLALRETCSIPWVILYNSLFEDGSVADPSVAITCAAADTLVAGDRLLFVEPPSSASLSENTSSLFQ